MTTKTNRQELTPYHLRDNAWYRKQLKKLRKLYPKHPDQQIGTFDFEVKPGLDFTSEQRALIGNYSGATIRHYDNLYKKLKKYSEIGFKPRKKGFDFTPQEKAALTRTYNQLAPLIENVESGYYTAIPIKKGKKRVVPEKVVKNFRATKKVIFVPEYKAKLKIKKDKRGKINFTITSKTVEKIEGRQREAIYIPIPEQVKADPTLMPYFMLWLTINYPSHFFKFSFRGKRAEGGMVFSPTEWGYVADRYISINYGEMGNPITGVWAIKYNRRKIKSLFGMTNKEQIAQLKHDILDGFGDKNPIAFINKLVFTD